MHGVCVGRDCVPRHESASRAVACRVVGGIASELADRLDSLQLALPDVVPTCPIVVLCVETVTVFFAFGVGAAMS